MEVISGHFAVPYDPIISVCITNSTRLEKFPIEDRKKCAISCTTKTVMDSHKPVWNSVCSHSNKIHFAENSRVSFEFYNYVGDDAPPAFFAGASITIPEVLRNFYNNRVISMYLNNGLNPDKINVRINYSPNK